MAYIPQVLIDEIEELKDKGDFTTALKKINTVLVQDPYNEDALLQITDIQYRQGEIDKADKAIEFLNTQNKNSDPLGLYIKGVLEMEKTNWKEAKSYFQKAMYISKHKNHELVRCYGICEFWYGNRNKGLEYLEDAFAINNKDAELVYNMIELYLLEQKFAKAKKMIKYYHSCRDSLQLIDKEISYYDMKILLFEKFLSHYLLAPAKKKNSPTLSH